LKSYAALELGRNSDLKLCVTKASKMQKYNETSENNGKEKRERERRGGKGKYSKWLRRMIK
jgi:hypothetical protein